MNLIVTILEQGLIYGILSLGLYITYKILDFPDLTVDGSFPLGAAVTAALITRGVNPYLTLLVAFAAGVLAGICTGLIHVKCKVRDLLSGIIMMTALWTMNLYIAGTANVPLFSQQSIFKNDFINGLPSGIKPYMTLILILVLIGGVLLFLLFALCLGVGLLLGADRGVDVGCGLLQLGFGVIHVGLRRRGLSGDVIGVADRVLQCGACAFVRDLAGGIVQYILRVADSGVQIGFQCVGILGVLAAVCDFQGVLNGLARLFRLFGGVLEAGRVRSQLVGFHIRGAACRCGNG